MKRLVGERRALAAAVMAFYGTYCLLGVLSPDVPLAVKPLIGSLGGVYGLAFVGLVAGYFWARWFAAGLALFGVILGAIGVWQSGLYAPILFILISNGLAALILHGEAMAQLFDGQLEWRKRLSMDDHAVHRLGNAVTRAGVSLPMVLIWALQPRAGGLALGAAGLLLLATTGLLRLRTWGVLAMVGAAGLLVGSVVTAPSLSMAVSTDAAWVPTGAPLAALAAGLLLAGALPFFAPIRRFLHSR